MFLRTDHLPLSFLPQGLAEETLRTITLLFSEHGKSARARLHRQMGARKAEKGMGRLGPVLREHHRIQSYNYWRDRLVDLKETFDQTKPTTWRQWLHDRRNTPEWAAFWIAMVILFLTLVQCIEGSLQAYKAYHPTRV
jgi:hypothetical protein